MEQFIPALVVLGIVILVFVLIREIVMWYYKINERIELQKETNRLLHQIFMKLPSEPLKSENQTEKKQDS